MEEKELKKFKFPEIGENSIKSINFSQEQIEEIKKNAREQAYQEAYREAYQKADQEIEKTKNELYGFVQWMKNPLSSVSQEAQDHVFFIIKKICSAVLRKEFSQDKDLILNVIKNCFDSLEEHQSIKIFLSPSDYAYVKKSFPKIFNEKNNVEFLEDVFIKIGDFRIQTDRTYLDGMLESRISLLLDSLSVVTHE